MLELRWVVFGQTRQLEYRTLAPRIDHRGALLSGQRWSDWVVVPEISADDASYEDLIASGGIVGDT